MQESPNLSHILSTFYITPHCLFKEQTIHVHLPHYMFTAVRSLLSTAAEIFCARTFDNMSDGNQKTTTVEAQEMRSVPHMRLGELLEIPPPGTPRINRRIPITTVVPFNTPSPTPSGSLETVSECQSYVIQRVEAICTLGGPTSPRASGSFNLSLVSDTSESDEEGTMAGSYDSMVFHHSVTPQRASIPNSSRGLGLGISGLSPDNEDVLFDGLGLVHNSRHLDNSPKRGGGFEGEPSESKYTFPTEDCSSNVSETMLQEILLTFTEDPFHRHLAQSSPPRESKRQGQADQPVSELTPRLACCSNEAHSSAHGHGRTRHFSLPTISSQLKRASSKGSRCVLPARCRTTSCPSMTYAGGGSARLASCNKASASDQ